MGLVYGFVAPGRLVNVWGMASTFGREMAAASIRLEPEELLRAGDGIRVRTGRAEDVRERAREGRRGLQMKVHVRPTYHRLVAHLSQRE